ncbi:hypothetical protein GCM10027418_06990 [Mariniluteicoccus endophyticus]
MSNKEAAAAGGEVVAVRADAGQVAELAEQLVQAARVQGIELTGEGGLLTALTRQVLQSALEVEMAEHLGYDKHDPAGRNRGNSRNGTSRKTVTTEIGKVTLDVPRDREGTFVPAGGRQAPAPAGRVRSGGGVAVCQGDDHR